MAPPDENGNPTAGCINDLIDHTFGDITQSDQLNRDILTSLNVDALEVNEIVLNHLNSILRR